MKKIRIFGVFLLLISLGCFTYFVFLSSILGMSVKFNYFFLIAGIILAGFGLICVFSYGRLSRIPRRLLFVIEGIVFVGCFIFIIIEMLIIWGQSTKPRQADYIIVLGAKVNNDKPSLSLKSRLDTAYEYLITYPDSKAVVSGGQGYDEGISEALCMYNYLTDKGIDGDRIIMEDKSTNTVENLSFTANIIGKEASCVVVTNDFHVFRSVNIGKKMGYIDITGLGADSLWYLVPTNYVREFMAIIKDFIKGNI